MVLSAQRRRAAPGVLRQGPDGQAGRVGVRGVTSQCQAKLKAFTEALKRLARRGLTAAAVIANFHRQRVLPLMERRLAIFQLTPEAASEGSWMSGELLFYDVAAKRAKIAVVHFSSDTEELCAIKMRPEVGYIQLRRIALTIDDFVFLSFLS